MIISNILGIIVFTSYLTFLHLVISLLSLFFFFLHKAVRDICASLSGLRLTPWIRVSAFLLSRGLQLWNVS